MSWLKLLGPLIFAGFTYATTAPLEYNDNLAVAKSTRTTCGGYIEAPGVISMSNIAANTTCIWAVNSRYSPYFGLSDGTLLPGRDRLAIYRVLDGELSIPTRISGTGSIVTMPGTVFLVTLTASDIGYPDRSFTLNIYSGGPTNTLTGFHNLTTHTGNISYPSGGGNYQNNENALFVMAPPSKVNSTNITFTSFDLEQNRDFLRLYSFRYDAFFYVANFTGSAIPAPVTLGDGGMGVLIFTSDGGVTARGFGFNWTTEGRLLDVDSGGGVISNVLAEYFGDYSGFASYLE